MIPGSLPVVVLLPLAATWLLPGASLLPFLQRQQPARPPHPPGRMPRLLILVPAHDESLLIGGCVASLLGMRRQRASVRVIVIADNCQDETAAIARQFGAEVLERIDPGAPGKPAAIAWALRRLEGEEYEAVVIVDADTVVDPGFADAIADFAPLEDLALQTRFGVANEGDSWLTRLASLWVDVRYDRQFIRKQCAGLNIVLTGNGMCFGRDWLERVGWISEGLTEDLALYARATSRGERIGYAPGARIFAQEAEGMKQGVTQRQRWQAGKWEVLREEGAALVRSRRIGFGQKLDALAELVLPGPVTHSAVAILGAACGLALGGMLATITAGLFLLSLLPLGAAVLPAIARRPDRRRLLLDLLMLPVYAVWRLGVSLSGRLKPRDGTWRRSPRHAPPPAP